jgi:hypothetical protein
VKTLRPAVISLEVCPVSGDQRLTSVGKDEHELQAAGHAGMPENLQRLPLKWMVGTGDGHPFWEVLMVGSVWWCPLTTFSTIYCWKRWHGGSMIEQ